MSHRRRLSPGAGTIRVVLAVFTLVVRLPLLFDADFVTYDGTYYINQAQALLGGSLSGGAFPIGYPLLIAPLLAVVRDGVLAGALVSLLASVGSVIVFEALCHRHMHRPLSLFAAVVFAITPLFMRASVLTLSESAYTFWVLLSLFHFERRPWASGLAIGMAAATRPEALAIAAALGLVAAFRIMRGRSDASPRALAALLLCFVVVYGASVAALSVAHGRVTLLSRAGAFRSVAMPWQLREKSIDYPGRERIESALERGQPEFDRRASYGEVMGEEVVGLSRQLMYLVPALAVVGVVAHRGFVAVALIPLLFIPFFTEARGQLRWLVPYLAPMVYYAFRVVDAAHTARARTATLATVMALALALASLWINRGVFATGVESEYESTREVARRFASRLAPGDAIADRKPYFAFYAGARYVAIPAAPYQDTVAYLAGEGVRFLALHAKTVDRLRPALRPLVFDGAAVRGELRYRQIVQESTGELIYERTGAADSLTFRRLTRPEVGDLTPAWSPDGRRIALRRYLPDGGAAIVLVDREGSNERELARTSRERDPIAWSPDGARIVYTTLADGNFDVVALDIRTHATTRLAGTTSHEWSPTFARTTGAFAFCSDRDGTPAAWMEPRGARAPVRVSPTRTVADLVSLAPSGDRMDWVDLEGRLIFWHIAAGEGMGVFEPRGVISSASWSPDERVVVVEAFDWGVAHLYLVDANDGRALMLTHSRTGEGMPSWSPDGSEIAAVTARDGTPSVWVLGNLAPYLDRLREKYDVVTLERPEQLRTPPPEGLRRVLPAPGRQR